MGIFDVVKSIGESVYNEMENNASERAKWLEKYSRLSDAQLKREYEQFKDGYLPRGTQRYFAFREECRNRGFLND